MTIFNVFTLMGGLPVRLAAREAGLPLIDYFRRPELECLNAVPTAEGCLELLLRLRERTIWESSFLVLGYGRVGRAVFGFQVQGLAGISDVLYHLPGRATTGISAALPDSVKKGPVRCRRRLAAGGAGGHSFSGGSSLRWSGSRAFTARAMTTVTPMTTG